jgi:hypothetical protein
MTDQITTPDTTTAATVDAAEVAKLRQTVEGLTSIADAMLATIPENLKPLIPADLDAGAKMKWFLEAQKTGVFAKPVVPATDGTKPTITPKTPDLSDLPPIARMARGYSK